MERLTKGEEEVFHLEELGGLLADQVKFYRFKNQVRILLKAQKFLGEAGVNPRRVPLKTLIPSLEEGKTDPETLEERLPSLMKEKKSSLPGLIRKFIKGR